MMEDNSVVLVILGMSVVVLLTRIGGYLVGVSTPIFNRFQALVEILPGCALMSLIAPSVLAGSVVDIFALITAVVVMWVTDSVALATILGLGILLVNGTYLMT